jgi:excinuclease ABC subunit A
VIAEGTPEQIAANPDSYTGAFLQRVLGQKSVPVGSQQPELVEASTPAGRTNGQRSSAKKPSPKRVGTASESTKRRVPASKAS